MIKVTRLRAGLKIDRSSGELVRNDWDNTEDLVIENCLLAPINYRDEVLPEGSITSNVKRLYVKRSFPDIKKDDRIKVGNQIFEIIEEPQFWHRAANNKPAVTSVLLELIADV